MHPPRVVHAALRLGQVGYNATQISRQLGVPRPTVRDWLAGKRPGCTARSPNGCDRCGHEHDLRQLPPEYVYLLGLYLGDGCISKHRREVFKLRVFLDLRYPQIIDACESAMKLVIPQSKVHRLNRTTNFTLIRESVARDEPTNVEVSSFSKAWPCLFPQHGPGRKHERRIVLSDWQVELVDRCPEQLLRGLIHSDGCRFLNTGRGDWCWPRYGFSNKSDDIRGIFCYACDRLGVHWTKAGEKTIYVSRKADVAKLDEFIGPKC
jgi:hypothetical protein